MAYVLGFFAADGTMIENKRGGHFVEFHSTDEELILLVRKLMRSNHKISIRNKHNEKWKTAYRVQIGSNEIFGDLENLGFSPNKSLTMRLPKISKEFLGDFVRGYFDGDGCIYFKEHFAKDRNKNRWVFSTRFTCGSRKFLESLHIKLNLNGGFVTNKTRGFELVFSHKDSVALYHLMYHNECRGLYLNRKHKLFCKALRILYGINNAPVAQR